MLNYSDYSNIIGKRVYPVKYYRNMIGCFYLFIVLFNRVNMTRSPENWIV